METTELELTQMFKSIGEIPVEAAKQYGDKTVLVTGANSGVGLGACPGRC